MAESHLLALPPELRTEIYRIAVTEEEPVTITATGYPRSALLLVNRAVRSEALGLYYAENEFEVTLRQWDCRTALQFCKSVPTLHDGQALHFNRGIFTRVLYDSGHWSNLLQWLQLLHAGDLMVSNEIVAVAMTAQEKQAGGWGAKWVAVAALFTTARQLQGVSWSVVKDVLMEQRAVLEAVDSAWIWDENEADDE